MTRLPVGSVTRPKLASLHSSACTPQLYLSLEGNQYDFEVNATLYEIEIGVLSGSEVAVHRRFVRFSGLELFDKSMRQIRSNAKYLPPFPPKKFFGNLSEQFVNQRALQLQKYLQALPQIPDLMWQISFAKVFDIDVGYWRSSTSDFLHTNNCCKPMKKLSDHRCGLIPCPVERGVPEEATGSDGSMVTKM
jgi:hypothetical protein